MENQTFHLLQAGEGRRHEARGSEMFFKATGESTGGAFSLMERSLPAGGRMPPAHIHPDCTEAYYVLDGEVMFVIAGTEQVGTADAFVLVPGGTAHTFGNRSANPARLLVLHAPALDGYFAELEKLWSGRKAPSAAAERELMSRFGMLPA